MFRVLRRTVSILALAMLVNSAFGFSLQGPYATWQTPALGYNVGNVDMGGPMNLGEEYRWNVKTITYGFDAAFLNYFGERGVEEVKKAIAIYNNLPPFSKMSRDLNEFPLDTRRENTLAGTLSLLDLKTETLGILAIEIGLADPERYVFTLRNRETPPGPFTNWFTVMRNFDPVTLTPSKYVNGNLYTYDIFEGTVGGNNFADAFESAVDLSSFTTFNSVAGIADGGNVSQGSLLAGSFFTGLTRDDIGGLRYIYAKRNLNVENLLPGSFGAGGQIFTPVGGLSNAVDLAIRPGIDKIQFKEIKFYGFFLPVTNSYTETFINITNNPGFKQSKQRISRVLATQPDILFSAGDNGISQPQGQPFLIARTTTVGPPGWINNTLLNNAPGGGAGPGVIQGPIIISFSNVGLTFYNTPVLAQGEYNSSVFFGGWAAFDGTTNLVIFPNGASIQALEDQIRQHGL